MLDPGSECLSRSSPLSKSPTAYILAITLPESGRWDTIISVRPREKSMQFSSLPFCNKSWGYINTTFASGILDLSEKTDLGADNDSAMRSSNRSE